MARKKKEKESPVVRPINPEFEIKNHPVGMMSAKQLRLLKIYTEVCPWCEFRIKCGPEYCAEQGLPWEKYTKSSVVKA